MIELDSTVWAYLDYLLKIFVELVWVHPVVDREKGTVIGAYNLNWKTLSTNQRKMESSLEIPFLSTTINVAALVNVGWVLVIQPDVVPL